MNRAERRQQGRAKRKQPKAKASPSAGNESMIRSHRPSKPQNKSVPTEGASKFYFENCDFNGSCKAFIKAEGGSPTLVTFDKMRFRGAQKVVEGKNVHVELKDVDIE